MKTDRIDYSKLPADELQQLERDTAAVLTTYGGIFEETDKDTPEWYDDLEFEHFHIMRELSTRSKVTHE